MKAKLILDVCLEKYILEDSRYSLYNIGKILGSQAVRIISPPNWKWKW